MRDGSQELVFDPVSLFRFRTSVLFGLERGFCSFVSSSFFVQQSHSLCHSAVNENKKENKHDEAQTSNEDQCQNRVTFTVARFRYMVRPKTTFGLDQFVNNPSNLVHWLLSTLAFHYGQRRL